MVDVSTLEPVVGIARFHEQMFIARGPDGLIAKLYDWHGEEIPVTDLYKSFMIVTREDGIEYKGEFIPQANAFDTSRKRSLGYQRMRTLLGHEIEETL